MTSANGISNGENEAVASGNGEQDQDAATSDLFEEDNADARLSNLEAFIVDVDGFEGPLDLLLALARDQKLDLAKISVLALAQQYLDFISEARKLRLELAADYLVMAAWLAYLKSKLLLPPEEDDEEGPSGEELAALLAFRLKRLEAMRDAAAKLMTGKRLGRDVFARGMAEGVRLIRTPEYQANVYDLLKVYAEQRQRTAITSVKMVPRNVWSIKEAKERLTRMLGISLDWFPIATFLTEFLSLEDERKTVLASTFGATLEMTRDGYLELKQDQAFAPLYLRQCVSESE